MWLNSVPPHHKKTTYAELLQAFNPDQQLMPDAGDLDYLIDALFDIHPDGCLGQVHMSGIHWGPIPWLEIRACPSTKALSELEISIIGRLSAAKADAHNLGDKLEQPFSPNNL